MERYTFEQIKSFHEGLKKRVEKERSYPSLEEKIILDPLEWNELGLLVLLNKVQDLDFIKNLGKTMKEHDGFTITIKVRKKE